MVDLGEKGCNKRVYNIGASKDMYEGATTNIISPVDRGEHGSVFTLTATRSDRVNIGGNRLR